MNKYFRIEYILKGLPVFTQKDIIFRLKQFPSIYRETIDIFDDNIDGKGYERLSIYPMFNSKKFVDHFMSKRTEELNEINKIMLEHEREVLFPNPEKVKTSWKIRDYLMERLPENKLNTEFNCNSYREFNPLNIHQKNDQIPQSEDSHTPC